MISLVGLKAKLAVAGAAALSFLFLFLRMQSLKNQRDKAVVVSETLTARHHTQKVQKKIKREEEKKLVSRRAEIIKEIEAPEEEFDGIDNLTDANDY
jgi:thymidine kinase